MLPTTWVQILVVVLAVVPGFVYQITRRSLRGPSPDEVELGVRVLRSIVTSALFAGLYLMALGQRLVDAVMGRGLTDAQPRWTAAVGLALVVIVPVVSAHVVFYLTTAKWWQRGKDALITQLRLRRPYDPTPSAWDASFSSREPGWVRVLTTDGVWIGGWFGLDSFATSFPIRASSTSSAPSRCGPMGRSLERFRWREVCTYAAATSGSSSSQRAAPMSRCLTSWTTTSKFPPPQWIPSELCRRCSMTAGVARRHTGGRSGTGGEYG